MRKRDFLRWVGVGVGIGVVRPVTAAADRIRILGAGGEVERFAIPGQLSPEFTRVMTSARVGGSRAHGALLVFWLHAEPPATSLGIATLDEARTRGDLLITERDQATVPTLVVENRGKTHVLLLAGEILLGGKQNRVVTEDVLLPPRSRPVPLAVYCVEQGRWAGRATHFESRGTFAAPALRARVMERAPQSEVWTEVNKYAAKSAAPSSTGSYQAIYDKPEVQAHQKEVEQAIDHRAAPGARGAAVFAGERLTALDLFQDATLFARQWPKLLHAHAIETYDRRSERPPEARALRSWLEDLLLKTARTEGSLRGNAGVGALFEFRVDRLRGSALIAEGQVVHAAVL